MVRERDREVRSEEASAQRDSLPTLGPINKQRDLCDFFEKLVDPIIAREESTSSRLANVTVT
jgi:hypothetical protein